MQRLHYDILVFGHVQGVWFRQGTRDVAVSEGIHGFAMNLPDGSVRIEAEGPQEALDKLVTWCRIGPPTARVQEVVVNNGPLQHHTHFHVRR